LNCAKKGANCAYWVGQNIRKCVGLEQCNSNSQESPGECVQKRAPWTKQQSRQICESYDDYDNNNDNDTMPPIKPPLNNCDLQNSCKDCSKEKGCSWFQDYYPDKCGFGRSACRAGDVTINSNSNSNTICPVREAPSCEATFPDLVGRHVVDAKEFLETTYGTGTFCIYKVLQGDPVTEDYRCDRIRLFTDTNAIVVEVPRVA